MIKKKIKWSYQYYVHRFGNFHLALNPIMQLCHHPPNSLDKSSDEMSDQETCAVIYLHIQHD